MACSPNSPQVGHVVSYLENAVVYSATITALYAGTLYVDLNVSGLGNRTHIDHAPCMTPNHWGCPGENCPKGGVWTSGSDERIKQPV
jgi:hypothetical protein